QFAVGKAPDVPRHSFVPVTDCSGRRGVGRPVYSVPVVLAAGRSSPVLSPSRTPAGSRQAMLVQQVLHAVDAESLTSGVGKQDVSITSWWLPQPGLQDNEGRSGDGRTAFFAPLSHDPHMGTGSQNDVLTLESGHLREAQAGLYGQQNEGVITPARPSALIRSRK